MKLHFYEPSDLCLKYRRNLLFTAILGIIHFHYIKLNTMKIFNVTLPENAINIGLPIIIIWFFFNYIFYTYAEFTQWKANFILHREKKAKVNTAAAEIVIKQHDLPFLPFSPFSSTQWKHTTLVPSITKLTDNEIELCTCFHSSPHDDKLSKKINTKKEYFPQEIEKMFKDTLNNLFVSIKTDIKRIDSFEKALNNFTFANKLKFYLFDIFTPLAVALYSIYLSFEITLIKYVLIIKALI